MRSTVRKRLPGIDISIPILLMDKIAGWSGILIVMGEICLVEENDNW